MFVVYEVVRYSFISRMPKPNTLRFEVCGVIILGLSFQVRGFKDSGYNSVLQHLKPEPAMECTRNIDVWITKSKLSDENKYIKIMIRIQIRIVDTLLAANIMRTLLIRLIVLPWRAWIVYGLVVWLTITYQDDYILVLTIDPIRKPVWSLDGLFVWTKTWPALGWIKAWGISLSTETAHLMISGLFNYGEQVNVPGLKFSQSTNYFHENPSKL